MQITSEFTVAASPANVYETLLDFERVGQSIPGATVGAAAEDGSHPAEIAVRLGPMRLTYRGTIRLEERADSERRAMMIADVRELRGQGTARAQMSMIVSERGSGSHVAATTDVQLSGRAAQMGAGIVEGVAGRLVADMASNLEQLLDGARSDETAAAGAPGAPIRAQSAPRHGRPIGGVRLLLRALWHRLWHRHPHRAEQNS